MRSSSPQRQRILASAVEVLATSGQGALTVRTVAQRSGMSTSGIYTWFGGKDGLLDAIFIDGFTRFRAALAEADVEADPLTRLRRSGDLYWEWALANPTHYLLMFVGVPGTFTPSDAAVTAGEAALGDLVDRVLAVGVAPDDAPRVSHHVWAVVHGYTSLEVAAPSADPDTARQWYSRAVDAMLAAL